MRLFIVLAVGMCFTTALAGVDDHWSPPVQAGKGSWTGLFPQDCGQCHPEKLSQWQTSGHSHAFSPGLLGQILSFERCDQVIPCLKCHAPLQEQQVPWQSCTDPSSPWQDKSKEWLVESGVSCAACHQRNGQIVAPHMANASSSQVHTSLQRVPWLSQSQMCRPCHQFSADLAVNGKPVQNTFAEWQASPFPARGVTCQGCHMPAGQHLFHGIHHAEMVAKGLEVTAAGDEKGGVYKVRSMAIGHAFPTYMVPRVTLQGWLLDDNGNKIAAGYRERILQRQMAYEGENLQEISDSRLMPGEEVKLTLPWQVGGVVGKHIRFALRIEPDYFYQTEVYARLLAEPGKNISRQLISKAYKDAVNSRFTLFEKTITRP